MSFMANCKTFQFDSNINRERIIIQKLYFSPTPFHHPSTYHTMHPLSRPFISSLVHHHQLIPFWSNDHRIHWVTVQDSTREMIKDQHEVLHVFLTFHCNPMRLTLFTFPARLSFSRIPRNNKPKVQGGDGNWMNSRSLPFLTNRNSNQFKDHPKPITTTTGPLLSFLIPRSQSVVVVVDFITHTIYWSPP